MAAAEAVRDVADWTQQLNALRIAALAERLNRACGGMPDLSCELGIVAAALNRCALRIEHRLLLLHTASDRKGWFAAFRDPVVGRALALMHARVAHDWTTDELAAEVSLSRSAFAERFSQLVGAPPITYLTDWQMQLAAARLRDTPRTIGQIAADLGYESEATFTRAFKRATGLAPGKYRSEG